MEEPDGAGTGPAPQPAGAEGANRRDRHDQRAAAQERPGPQDGHRGNRQGGRARHHRHRDPGGNQPEPYRHHQRGHADPAGGPHQAHRGRKNPLPDGNRAEEVIGMEYNTFMREKQLINRLVPKTTPHFNKMLQTRRMNEQVEEKPLYKMKMFKDVGSKVAEGVKMFKTYHPMKRKDNLDHLIEKVENDIQKEEPVQN